MKCTPEIQQKVKDNMGLVGKVIKDKVHNLNGSGFYSYEDLYQIGYIGLCKAALTDKGGCFSTYAYRLIWNEICDALTALWGSGYEKTARHHPGPVSCYGVCRFPVVPFYRLRAQHLNGTNIKGRQYRLGNPPARRAWDRRYHHFPPGRQLACQTHCCFPGRDRYDFRR